MAAVLAKFRCSVCKNRFRWSIWICFCYCRSSMEYLILIGQYKLHIFQINITKHKLFFLSFLLLEILACFMWHAKDEVKHWYPCDDCEDSLQNTALRLYTRDRTSTSQVIKLFFLLFILNNKQACINQVPR